MDLTEEQQDFFNKHSMKLIEMAYNFNRHEKVYRPDGYGTNIGDCGDTVSMALTTLKKVIQHVSLEIDGCAYTNACANTVAQFVEGKTIDEAWEIAPEQIAHYLETLPEDHFHCAELAVGALFRALADFNQRPVTRH
jgi:nitrogen fixation NifU-like protein